ncbi:MAG: hypothetical protein DME24_17950 [Verrucomicrobia bacterium]|nr:MAG: hypothetical protein DME24_17950 [Verrucomicrobiota bacterium]
MQVVGHEQEQIWPPQKLFLTMTNGFKQACRDFGQGELISKTLFAVDGDEINLLLRINPRRDFVRQRFATCDFHGGRIGGRDDGRQNW